MSKPSHLKIEYVISVKDQTLHCVQRFATFKSWSGSPSQMEIETGSVLDSSLMPQHVSP